MHTAKFIKQKSYEKVIYSLHRHPLTFLPYILLLVILGLVPLGGQFLITNLWPNFIAGSAIYTIGVLFGSLYYVGILTFFFTEFVLFYLDFWIVTNDRIVDVKQIGLFSLSISELDLFRIQDVSTEVHGFFNTIFDYGNILIKTASNNSNIIFLNVPHPNKIREELIQLSDKDRKYHYGSVAEESS